MSEIILGQFNTTFGEVIIVSPDKEYKVGDIISTNEGEFCIRQIIPQIRPKEELQVSFVASQVNNTRILWQAAINRQKQKQLSMQKDCSNGKYAIDRREIALWI